MLVRGVRAYESAWCCVYILVVTAQFFSWITPCPSPSELYLVIDPGLRVAHESSPFFGLKKGRFWAAGPNWILTDACRHGPFACLPEYAAL